MMILNNYNERYKKHLLLIILFFSVFLAVLLLPEAEAKSGHIKLLAVSKSGDDYKGSVADMYLEVQPGRGRVFIDTFPLTKLDTQLSTRFAKEVACQYLNRDCETYDFFYTIISRTSIVGGPSAGAAATLLTIATLEGFDISEDVTVTGTINSGGFIGSVGGIKEKLEAAAEHGISLVFIPEGERFITEKNVTFDLIKYASELGLDVEEASTIDDIVSRFTGKKRISEANLTISPTYTRIMKNISSRICERPEAYEQLLLKLNQTILNESYLSKARNLTARARAAVDKGEYYAASSYCFGANIYYAYLALKSRNMSSDEIEQLVNALGLNITSFESCVSSRTPRSFLDLQATMIVKERLRSARIKLEEARKWNSTNNTDEALYNLAFASERLFSAILWDSFFGVVKEPIKLDKEALMRSCMRKISEAQERISYVRLFFPNSLDLTEETLNSAYDDLSRGEYAFCLLKASKAKADADMIINSFSIDVEKMNQTIDRRAELVKTVISHQASKGLFPVLGYSYFEYAQSLKVHDPFSSLLYLEYSLELSNLDMYFNKARSRLVLSPFVRITLAVFFMGVLFGTALTLLVTRRFRKPPRVVVRVK